MPKRTDDDKVEELLQTRTASRCIRSDIPSDSDAV